MKPFIPGLTIFALMTFAACSQSGVPSPNSEKPIEVAIKPLLDGLEGFWESVYFEEAGIQKKNTQVKAFHDGKFMLINRDTTGKLAYAAYGTYVIEGNIYKETFTFFGDGTFNGWSDWQDWSMVGDTLVMKGFTRVTKPDGTDDTKNWKPILEKRVRLP